MQLLPEPDRDRLLARCDPVQLQLGEVLCEPGVPLDFIGGSSMGAVVGAGTVLTTRALAFMKAVPSKTSNAFLARIANIEAQKLAALLPPTDY